jgi:hypothetical protein
MSTATKVIELRVRHPEATLRALGDAVGVTYERVRQILNENNLPTKSSVFHAKELRRCKYCGLQFDCPASSKQLFCSRQCREIYIRLNNRILLECCVCHKLFYRSLRFYKRAMKSPKYRTKQVFCSRQCLGHYVGKHNGRGAQKLMEEK